MRHNCTSNKKMSSLILAQSNTLWYSVTFWYSVTLCDTLWCLLIPCDAVLVMLRVLKPCTDTKICEPNWCHLISVYGITDRHDIEVTPLRYSGCVSMWCHHKLCVLNELSPNRALYMLTCPQHHVKLPKVHICITSCKCTRNILKIIQAVLDLRPFFLVCLFKVPTTYPCPNAKSSSHLMEVINYQRTIYLFRTLSHKANL